MTEFDPNVDPEQFAAMVKSASKDQLEAVMAGAKAALDKAKSNLALARRA